MAHGRHPLRGYGMGDFLTDMLSAGENAIKAGASSAEAAAASQILAQPDVAKAATDTAQRVAAESLSQQLLQQKDALAKTIAANKTYFMIGGGALALLVAYKFLKK